MKATCPVDMNAAVQSIESHSLMSVVAEGLQADGIRVRHWHNSVFQELLQRGKAVVDMVPVKGVVLFTDVCQDRFC
jgi:hypothetical protein